MIGSDVTTYPRVNMIFFFLMIRRPPRSTLDRSSAASDVYKRQLFDFLVIDQVQQRVAHKARFDTVLGVEIDLEGEDLSLIHISEPTRPY